MNKAILGILAAAIVATGKSVSSKNPSGSFGKKKNKELDAFRSWMDNYVSEACDQTSHAFDLEKRQGLEGLTVLTLDQAIDSLRGLQEEAFEEFCKVPENCPEAYAYASLVMGFSTYGNFPQVTRSFLHQGIGYGVEFGYHKGRRYLVDEPNLREFYQNCLADFEKIRNITGYSDEIETENIIKRNLSFFIKSDESYQPTLFPQLQEQEEFEIENDTILSVAIHGYMIMKYIECIISMVFDKNLAEAVKSYYLRLAEQGRIYTGKHSSYNVDLLVINQRTTPTQTIFMARPSRLYISRFIGRDYVGQILGRINKKLSQHLDSNTMIHMRDVFNDFEDVSTRYRDRVRAITQPRADEVDMSDFCLGFLADLHSLSMFRGEITLQDTDQAWDTLESNAGQFGHEDYEALDLYADLTLSGTGAEIKRFLEFGIMNFDSYCEAVAMVDSSFAEARSGRLDIAMAHWVNEANEMLESELETLSEGYKIGESSIKVNPQDQIIMQLPISDIQQIPLSNQENVSRVILVEYRNPKTLTSITQNTAGNLCVGKDDMPYKRRLSSGEQRHFGVLAQKQDGSLYVMYHTHTSGGGVSDFTDAKNSKKAIPAFPRHHRNTLQSANEKIKELIQ